ncbi:MAG: carbohydrate-binding family 9-like protein [Saprospiraceae bacterium]|nr:carbohydrate-binding family 9-like protein [Saprospiraceae bacterium]
MNTYKVQKVEAFTIHSDWDKAPWNKIEAISLNYHMGEKPEHFPAVQSKVAYDEAGIYVIFKVDDQYIRAVRTKHQEAVCNDSCVEFFFSTAKHSEDGYFNLELNCGGTMLLHHQIEPRKNSVAIQEEDLDKIAVATSMPKIVFPEITEETTWTAAYHLPFEVLQKYQDLEKPTKGTVWRGNFYKCADESSHPHWLTWAKVENPKPDFHLPQFFGMLEF